MSYEMYILMGEGERRRGRRRSRGLGPGSQYKNAKPLLQSIIIILIIIIIYDNNYINDQHLRLRLRLQSTSALFEDKHNVSTSE